jgi:hypothetical protein
MSRPHAYRGDGVRCIFVDAVTGDGVRDDGRRIETRYAPSGGRMRVGGLVLCAEAEGVGRVYLTGAKPSSAEWLDEPPPDGWRPAGHFYQLRDPVGRWRNARGDRVEIRRAASWLGEGDYTPAQAREAFRMVATLLRNETRGRVGLMGSPAAVGQSLWADSIGRNEHFAEQLDERLGDLIRSTSPQHREEVVGRCFDDCDAHLPTPRSKLGELHYLDAVFMYAACVRELGTAPVGHLEGERYAASFWQQYPHARARYRVRFAVPDGWAHPGLLPVKHPNGTNWHYPNRPGYEGESWCDGAELHLAERNGWRVTPVELIRFADGNRPLDRFAARVLRMREICEGERSFGVVAELASGAFRTMFIRAIGSFHSRGRERTYLIGAGEPLPPGVTDWQTRDDGRKVFVMRAELTGNAASFMRPELSAQVWARARARVSAAMLTVDPADIVAVWGDALYLACHPGWSGTKPGEFRVKRSLAGPVSRPKTIGELLKLRDKMRGDA